MTLEKYEKTLDIWANEEREKAAEAKQAGDERLMSIHLMRKGGHSQKRLLAGSGCSARHQKRYLF